MSENTTGINPTTVSGTRDVSRRDFFRIAAGLTLALASQGMMPAEAAAASKKSLAKARIELSAKRLYTGKKVCPSPTVTYNGKTLRKGKDYTVTFKNNRKVGIATVIVKGAGRFTGTKKKTFKIVRYIKTATTFETADYKVTVPKRWKGKWSVKRHHYYTKNGYVFDQWAIGRGGGALVVTRSKSDRPGALSYIDPYLGCSKNGGYVWQQAGAEAGFFGSGKAKIKVKN